MKGKFKEFWKLRNRQIIYYRAYKMCATAKQKALNIKLDNTDKANVESEKVKFTTTQCKEIVKELVVANPIYKDEFNKISKIEVNSVKSYVDVINGCLEIAKDIYNDNIPGTFIMKFLTTPIGRISLAESIVLMGSFLLVWDTVFRVVSELCG